MVLRNDSWEFSDLWIAIGIGLFVLLFLIGVGFHGPNYKKIHAIEEESGPDTPAALRLMRRGFVAARLEVVVLLVVVGLMVFKPRTRPPVRFSRRCLTPPKT